jgi:hypothetical protein
LGTQGSPPNGENGNSYMTAGDIDGWYPELGGNGNQMYDPNTNEPMSAALVQGILAFGIGGLTR